MKKILFLLVFIFVLILSRWFMTYYSHEANTCESGNITDQVFCMSFNEGNGEIVKNMANDSLNIVGILTYMNEGINNGSSGWTEKGYNGNGLMFNGASSYVNIIEKHLWAKYKGNPVLKSSQFGSVWFDGITYHLYYSNKKDVNHAMSSDGLNWKIDDSHNPVLIGEAGKWDQKIEVVRVFFDNGTWYMLYRGHNFLTGANALPYSHAIGLATSNDGLKWKKSSYNPVLKGTVGEWDGQRNNFDPWGIIKKDSIYYLIYNADSKTTGRSTGLATSTDLINWRKDSHNPIFQDGRFCIDIFKYGDYYYAIVPNGGYGHKTQFELYRDKNPTFYKEERDYLGYVLEVGKNGTFDDYYLDTPNIVTNNIYRNSIPSNDAKLYYTGRKQSTLEWSHGLATFNLPDLINYNTNADSLDFSNEFTIEMWVKRNEEGKYHELVSKRGDYGYAGSGYRLMISDNDKAIMRLNDDNRTDVISATPILQDRWYHLAFVWNETHSKIFINGILNKTKDNTGLKMKGNTNNVIIGRVSTANVNYFNGTLDELRMFKRAKSEAEIQNDYNPKKEQNPEDNQ